MELENSDIRWQQRFENYQKALIHLNSAVLLSEKRELSDLEKQGLIQGFEYTHELAWKTMQDYFKSSGSENIYGSKDATRFALKYNLIKEGDIWMSMIADRNISSHTYQEDLVKVIPNAILLKYNKEFQAFEKTMAALKIKK